MCSWGNEETKAISQRRERDKLLVNHTLKCTLGFHPSFHLFGPHAKKKKVTCSRKSTNSDWGPPGVSSITVGHIELNKTGCPAWRLEETTNKLRWNICGPKVNQTQPPNCTISEEVDVWHGDSGHAVLSLRMWWYD